MTEASPSAERLALLRAPGLTPRDVARLRETGVCPESLVGSSCARLGSLGLGERTARWLARPDPRRLDADRDWLRRSGCRLAWLGERDYPARLAAIPDPPLGLFVRGSPALLDEPQVAVVGARAASSAGRDLAERFAGDLAASGLVVTSGLALGIDGAAHRAALAAGGASVAVCGTGLDRVYPPRHTALAGELAVSGALVSELPPGAPPRREHFPRRNRIIAGLALGVLVVEAARASGSLITARLAAEQGREVFALPGAPGSPRVAGCHALIRHGALLVEEPAEILAELAPQLLAALPAPPPAGAAGSSGLDAREQATLRALDGEGVTVDTLVARTGLTAGALCSILTALEMRGLVAREPGARYARRAHRRGTR